MLAKLFKHLLIADAQVLKNPFERMYMKYRKEVLSDDQVKVHMVTTTEKVPALVKYLKKQNPNDDEYLPTDLSATELNSGSEEYFEWVRQQVKKPDPETKEAERDANNIQSSSDVNLSLKTKRTSFDKKFGLP